MDWCEEIILGCGGMNDYERYELVVWNEPERVAAARWALRCLANPACDGSEEVLKAIIKRRRKGGRRNDRQRSGRVVARKK